MRPNVCFKAAGNAYPVPLLISVRYRIVEAMAKSSSFVFASWPLPGVFCKTLPAQLNDFQKALRQKPKLIPKPKPKVSRQSKRVNSKKRAQDDE